MATNTVEVNADDLEQLVRLAHGKDGKDCRCGWRRLVGAGARVDGYPSHVDFMVREALAGRLR